MVDLIGLEICNGQKYAIGYHTFFRPFDNCLSCLDYVMYLGHDVICTKFIIDSESILGVESDHYPIVTEWSFKPLIEREKIINKVPWKNLKKCRLGSI